MDREAKGHVVNLQESRVRWIAGAEFSAANFLLREPRQRFDPHPAPSSGRYRPRLYPPHENRPPGILLVGQDLRAFQEESHWSAWKLSLFALHKSTSRHFTRPTASFRVFRWASVFQTAPLNTIIIIRGGRNKKKKRNRGSNVLSGKLSLEEEGAL